MFDLCSEMSSDSKNYFGFAVDEFSKFVHRVKSQSETKKRICEMKEYFWENAVNNLHKKAKKKLY